MATFFNRATLSYSGGIVNSNITSGEITEVLSATKTAVIDEYSPNSEITYAINIVNSGSIAFNGLVITDNLGAYTVGASTLYPLDYIEGSVKYFVNGVLQSAPAVTSDTSLAISGINVPAGGIVTVLYTVRTNSFAPPEAGSVIENTAIINGGGITDITVSETINAASRPLLDIAKSLSPAVVTENGQVTYTFVIQNLGNAPALEADSIVISDTFDPILTDISVSYNGDVLTSPGEYTYNQATGEFATVAGVVTVPAATYTRDPETGAITTTPGTATLTVTGTI